MEKFRARQLAKEAIGGVDLELLTGAVGAVAAVALIVWFYLYKVVGNAKIVVHGAGRTPLVLEELTPDSALLSCVVEFANEGKQCATIMDCYTRHLLPYEQYDGVRVVSKAELAGAPRADDYFEAVLIQRGERIAVLVKLRLVDRTGRGIRAALAEMVDFPVDLVYQSVTRDPWRIDKVRLDLTAEEIVQAVAAAKEEKADG